MAITGLLWTSCSNEAIQIEADNYFDLTLQVNTDNLYERFSAKSSIMQQVLSSDTKLCLGVITLAYDADGNLADSVCTFDRSFHQFTQKMSLKEGTYTIISYENIFDPADNYNSQYWKFEGIDKLSTAQIVTDEEQVYWTGVVGISSQQLALNGDKTLNVTPAPVGVLVNIHYFNLDATAYDYIGFMTKNRPMGLRLDPSLTGDDRYVYDSYSKRNTWCARAVRYNRGGHLDATISQTAYMIESGNINWCFGPSTISENGEVKFTAYPSTTSYFNFTAGGYFYAGLYNTGSSLQCYMGERTGYNTWLDQMKNYVPPVETQLYRTPYLSWGGAVSTVKSYMSGYKLAQDITMDSEGKYYMLYEGVDEEELYEYDFTSQTSGLTDVYVELPSTVTIDAIGKQLVAEGFTYDGYNTEDKFYAYVQGSTSVIIYLTDDSKHWIVNYYDQTAYSSSVKAYARARRCLKR